jgi:hypothetical protein
VGEDEAHQLWHHLFHRPATFCFNSSPLLWLIQSEVQKIKAKISSSSFFLCDSLRHAHPIKGEEKLKNMADSKKVCRQKSTRFRAPPVVSSECVVVAALRHWLLADDVMAHRRRRRSSRWRFKKARDEHGLRETDGIACAAGKVGVDLLQLHGHRALLLLHRLAASACGRRVCAHI